jgi:hypothetical protein
LKRATLGNEPEKPCKFSAASEPGVLDSEAALLALAYLLEPSKPDSERMQHQEKYL